MSDMDELVRSVREAGLLKGDFILSSGRRSNYYLDKYRIETRPDILSKVAEAITPKIPVKHSFSPDPNSAQFRW